MGKRRVTKRRVARRRKRVKRTKVRGSRRQVWNGTRTKTVGSLQKGDLMQNKRGRIVSKKASKAGKKRYNQHLKPWVAAFTKARAKLGITGFVPCKKGTELYKETLRLYKA